MQERKDEVRQEVARGHIILGFLGQPGDFGFSSEGIEKGSEVSEERSDKIWFSLLKISLVAVVGGRPQRTKETAGRPTQWLLQICWAVLMMGTRCRKKNVRIWIHMFWRWNHKGFVNALSVRHEETSYQEQLFVFWPRKLGKKWVAMSWDGKEEAHLNRKIQLGFQIFKVGDAN